MSKNNNKKPKNNNQEASAKQNTTSKKSNTEKAKQDILKQYGLKEEHEPTQKEIETVEAQKENEKQKGKVPSKADDIGWNKPFILLRNALFGFFMGISDGIPGYSGGTTLNIIGFYQSLVNNFKMIFKPDVKKYFWKYLLWFIPFALVWIATLIGFSFLVDYVGETNNGVILVFLFGSFALFSIPLFYITNKDKCLEFKDFMSKTKSRDRSTIIPWILMISAFLIMIAIGLIARFVSQTEIIGEDLLPQTIYGVTFAKQISTNPQSFLTGDAISTVLPLLLLSFVSGFVVLIPGMSGGLIMYMGNWYSRVSTMISNVMSGEYIGESMPYLIVVVAGALLGIIVSSFVINYLIKKYEKYFYLASLGFVSGAFIAIFVSLSSYDYSFLAKSPITLAISITMIFVALIINVIIFVSLNETKKIDYPKFRIFNKNKSEQKIKN